MLPSMIVDDFNQAGTDVALAPDETDAPLFVDPDAVLALPVAGQPFKAIAGQSREVSDIPGRVQTLEPVLGLPAERLKSLDALSHGEAFGTRIPVAQDHWKIYRFLRVTSSVHFQYEHNPGLVPAWCEAFLVNAQEVSDFLMVSIFMLQSLRGVGDHA
jgi:hypothetical protein